MLIVYRPQQIPNAREVTEKWRSRARHHGFTDLHLCCALSHGNTGYEQFGFNSGVEFPPHNLSGIQGVRGARFLRPFSGILLDYREVATRYIRRQYDDPIIHKAVFPSWDNTARTGGRATVVINGTPENYEYWLKKTLEETRDRNPHGGGLLFINAWNEWAEGCHLEPDQKYGRGFLEATKRVKDGVSTANQFVHVGIPKDVAEDDRMAAAWRLRWGKRTRTQKKKASSTPFGWDKIRRETLRLKKHFVRDY